MCIRGFREILRSGKLAARFRSGVSRAVIARMLPGMPGDRIQAVTIRRYDGWPAVRRRSLRDVARPKSNLHVIRHAGRTTDGTRVIARVRKWESICGGSAICLPRVSVETIPSKFEENGDKRPVCSFYRHLSRIH